VSEKAKSLTKRQLNKALRASRVEEEKRSRIAQMIEKDDIDDYWLPQLSLEWVVDNYIQRKIEVVIPYLDQIYKRLKRRKTIKNKAVDYNDLDNSAYCLEHKNWNHIFVLSSQTTNFLFLFKSETFERQLHIRTFRDRTRYRDKHDSSVETLSMYRRQGFKLKYGDCRDEGYVYSQKGFRGLDERLITVGDRDTINYYSILQYCLVEIRFLCEALGINVTQKATEAPQ